ncbi:MAG: TGS domain-containing protein, partial [Planctomycetota bacterium]
MIRVQLPDGSVIEVAEGTTALDVARRIGERLAQQTVAAEVNGRIVDATRPLEEFGGGEEPIRLRLLTTRDPEALAV